MPAARRARLLVTVLLLAACTRLGAPRADGVLRVDGRSAESFEASMRKIKNELRDQQGELCDAILRIHAAKNGDVLQRSGGDLEAVQRALRECVHGMSVAEILAEGRAIAARR